MIDKTTTTASYVTSGIITTGGWFSAHDWPIYVGVGLGVSTFLINVYFKFRNDRRAEKAYQQEIAYKARLLELFEKAAAGGNDDLAGRIYEEISN